MIISHNQLLSVARPQSQFRIRSGRIGNFFIMPSSFAVGSMIDDIQPQFLHTTDGVDDVVL
jgi:hypothetical protein